MEFKDVIKVLRKEKAMKQSDLATVFKVDRTAVGKWEQGSNKPTADTLEMIADYFNVSIDYLMGRQENRGSFDAYKRNERDIKLLNTFSKLNDFGKSEALKRINELAELPKYQNAKNDMPIAAHNDAVIDKKELELMREDIDEL